MSVFYGDTQEVNKSQVLTVATAVVADGRSSLDGAFLKLKYRHYRLSFQRLVHVGNCVRKLLKAGLVCKVEDITHHTPDDACHDGTSLFLHRCMAQERYTGTGGGGACKDPQHGPAPLVLEPRD